MTSVTDFQENKALVRRFCEELDSSSGDELTEVLARYTSDGYFWRGMHPFYEQTGAEAVSEVFWKPFRNAFTSVQRRPDVFMAGLNEIDGFGSQWVCSMGHLMGLFDNDWLGIPATGKMGFLRYVEFHRIEGGKIQETALFCDVISVMLQAGLQPLPTSTGAFFVTPGPRTHDGLMWDAQNPEEGVKTLELINAMIRDLGSANNMNSDQDELARTWHQDMIWFGPAGIGATYTLRRYEAQHQGPFSRGLADIEFGGHKVRFAEGHYGGFFGWSNLSMRPSGGFLGLPSSDKRTEMRVVDIYRREGDKLAENWIFIDLLHFLSLQGVDVLGRLRQINRR